MRIPSYVVDVAAWLLTTTASFAHHSFAAVFDINRPIDFTGTVNRLEWANPHVWIHVAVIDTGEELWVSETRENSN